MGAEEEQTQGADQFKREVAETFLRCIKERISHDNAVIELNGLKIAEDRTFADCARYDLRCRRRDQMRLSYCACRGRWMRCG